MKYVLVSALFFFLPISISFAEDIPLEFYDNETALNDILEAIASTTGKEGLDETSECQERCEMVTTGPPMYLLCSRSCRVVYPRD